MQFTYFKKSVCNFIGYLKKKLRYFLGKSFVFYQTFEKCGAIIPDFSKKIWYFLGETILLTYFFVKSGKLKKFGFFFLKSNIPDF